MLQTILAQALSKLSARHPITKVPQRFHPVAGMWWIIQQTARFQPPDNLSKNVGILRSLSFLVAQASRLLVFEDAGQSLI